MIKAYKNKTKKIILSILLCFGIMLSAFTGISIQVPSTVMANTTNKISKDISSDALGSQYDFNTTSTAKPVTPNSSWSVADGSYNKDNIISGIVNLKDETTFDTETYKTLKPSMPNPDKTNDAYYRNLMINSHNGAGKLGYKSQSFTLEANSYYEISIYVYTQKTQKTENYDESDARASIYLTGLLDQDDDNYYNTKFEYFSTLGAWETYTFYVDTDASKTINVELWLGSKTANVQGAVFYNNVKVVRYSEDYYVENILEQYSDTANEESNNYNIISLSKSFTQPVTNSSFEEITLWDRISTKYTSNEKQFCKIIDVNSYSETVSDSVTINNPGSNCSANNDNALVMYNKTDAYQAVESTAISFESQKYYKLSFFAKSDCNLGNGATVKLVEKTDDENPTTATLTLSTTVTKDSNTFRNDWTEYAFYIYGPSSSAIDATIQVWLGTTDSETSGYVFVDDFRLQSIDYSTYTNNNSSTNCTAFNLNNGEDKYSVTNGSFDKTENATNTDTYPLVPTGWTRTGKTNNTFSGVIKTNEKHFEDHLDEYGTPGFYPVQLPALTEYTSIENNVLMIGSSAENNVQTYTSNELTMSSSNYYRISFFVATQYAQERNNTGARVKITSGDNVICDYFNIYFSDNNWHRFELLFKVGNTSHTAKINLIFENATGHVFFDEVRFESIEEIIYSDSSLRDPSVKTVLVDLSTETFDNRTYNKKYSNNNTIQEVNNWTTTSTLSEDEKIGVESGIIQLGDSRLNNVTTPLSNNKNVLYISSLHDIYYGYISPEQYTFDAQTYYKISINILTNNLTQDDPDENTLYGATIKLTDSKEIYISGISTKGEWQEYTIYVCLEESLTSSITLSLGADEQLTSGKVLFDNLVIKSIDKDTYESETSNTTSNTIKSFINYTETEDTEDEDEDVWENNFNWLIIPSLITALAIILAVICYYIRKIRFNRKPKVKTNYDRRKTLDKHIDQKEKIALRHKIIAELNAELVSIDKEIEDYNKLAEEKLEEIKVKIQAEQEEIKKQKLEIEIKKKEATAAREKALKDNPDMISNKRAEQEYEKFIAKLDKQEMSLQKQLTEKDVKLANARETSKSALSKYLERKEYINKQIEKIEAEIEEIAREEEQMWAEYRAAKAEAKKRKAEYKAQQKIEKEKAKTNKTKKTLTPPANDSVKSKKKFNTSNKK